MGRRDLIIARDGTGDKEVAKMIQRIEYGWVQVNENPSKRQRRQRPRPPRRQSQEVENGRVHKPPISKAIIDLVA